MKKKIIAGVLTAALVVSAVTVFFILRDNAPVRPPLDTHSNLAAEWIFHATDNTARPHGTAVSLSHHEILSGQTPRDGFVLVPTMFSRSGVDSLSAFVLRTPEGFGAALPEVTIDGQPRPVVVREDDSTFLVTPSIPLVSNSLNVFRVNGGEGELTWVFQTSVAFEIASTLPRNQSTHVPVRTGIEIVFSFGEDIDIAEHFRIYPRVEGEFIHRGSTAIFMPAAPLAYGQIYTVAVTSGVGAPGTSESIAADYVFSFETTPAPGTRTDWRSPAVHFFSHHVEFPSFAAPSVNFWLNYDRNTARPVIEMSLYPIRDRAQAIAAVNRLAGTPGWSQIPQEDRFVDVTGLPRVHASRITRNDNTQRWDETFTLPNTLPPGFYVLDAVAGDTRNQVIIQITDLAVQVIADNDKALLWINDMTTGQPVANAKVFDPITGRTATATAYGIAVLDRMLTENEYLVITAADGTEAVVFAHSSAFQHFWGGRIWSAWDYGGWNPWSNAAANSQYWAVLQLDRTLFQRGDTVSLWGFAQNRRSDENITHVTAVLTEHAWWWGAPDRDTLHRQNIPVANGSYAGEIRLPNLSPGSYELAVYHGDVLLSSVFFSVMDYVKPPYQLRVASDKQAIFAGEEVTFTARTEFFEGTPVPDLGISYSAWGWNLRTPDGGTRQTGLDGTIGVTMRPVADDQHRSEWNQVQGETQVQFIAEATLPEIGWVHEQAAVRVFINDIDVRAEASRTGRNANLSVNIHHIVLDRINDGTAEHWGDFLGAPKSGHRVSAEIVEIWWERVQDGQGYDFVTRQVVPRYRFVRRERVLQSFTMTTGPSGNARREFQVPDTEKRSYVARVTTTDGNGRTIRHDAFIGQDFTWFFQQAGEDFPFLYGANPDGYDLGDLVELTVMRGEDPVVQGNFLFVVVQDGILSYHVGRNTLAFPFGERHVPNVQVFAYHFNGHTYHTSGAMAQRLRYDARTRELVVSISTCKEEYRPGDTVAVTVSAADLSGTPKAANVNISLVDEALFALMDYSADTLAMLYRNISDSLRISLATHRSFISDGIENLTGFAGGTNDMMMAESALRPAATAAPGMGAERTADDGGSGTRIRERFEDTAIFASVRTNAQGEAVFTFTLPDNITSWRLTASGISDDLYAGNTVQAVRVSQPMFLHYTLNSVFLAGDKPYVGVNAYGTSLTGGERVTFEVWRENAPGDVRRATGTAFERVNIPLWEMAEEGFGELIIRVEADNGYNDAIRHPYQVLTSHRHVDVAKFYDVTPATVFDVNPGGLTQITFTDKGRGQFLHDLFSLRHIGRSGARLEALIARREATYLIQTHFPDAPLFGGAGSVNVLDYQTEAGGIAILPYAHADIQTTVLLIPFIRDDVNLIALRDYLWNAFRGAATANDGVLALYGLAQLGEPVLLELQRYARLADLSVRNAAYIGLAFAATGETHEARGLYDARIAPHVQRLTPYYRVNAGVNRAEILDATSVAALLAAKLGYPEAMGLHQYAVRNRFGTFDPRDPFRSDAHLLLNIERLLFIRNEIGNHANAAVSITYTLFGKTVTRDLGHGGQFTLRIPAQNMHEFKLISVAGEAGAVSIVRTPLEDLESVDTELTVRREFFKSGSNVSATTFEQGDLVRVQITVDYSRRAMSGSYIITDFLPAGLVHVANSARAGDRTTTPGWHVWAAAEGQRVTFYDFNGRFDRVHTYYYYARVINPGAFKAEGTLVQSVGAREYITVGPDALLTIR
jgi:hypothetical protein